MRKRLYVIEGTPCSGKSTTGKYLAGLLDAKYIDEGSKTHPADYEFHAFITEQELMSFSENERKEISEKSKMLHGGIICPISSFSGDLFDKLLQHKIYDFLPWNVEKDVMLDKWREFANFYVNQSDDKPFVFNSVILQNPMCETMMRFGFSKEESEAYIKEICDILKNKNINTIIIYLKSKNISGNVKNALPERGDEWLNGVIEYHINGNYGRSENLSGFDGYIKALEERQLRELDILQRLPVHSVIIENPQENWDTAYIKIKQMI